jgi:UrcA family protein
MKSAATLRAFGFSRGFFLGLLGSTIGFAAQAGESIATDGSVKTITVSYSDLDLTDPAGMKSLYGRLRFAARHACGDIFGVRDLRQILNYNACFDGAMNDAVVKLDNASLTAMHSEVRARSNVG